MEEISAPLKLNKKQLKRLQSCLDISLEEKHQLLQHLNTLVDEHPNADNDLEWHSCYEKPPEKLQMLGIMAMGLHEADIQSWDSLLAITDIIDGEEWDKRRHPKINRITALLILIALAHDLECFGRYGVHMHSLNKQARLGDNKALLQALDVDPTTIHCRAINKRFLHAQRNQNGELLGKIAKKLTVGSTRHPLHRKQMRLFIKLLHEQGQLDDYSNPELHELFQEIGVISKNDSPENTKTLKYKLLSDWGSKSNQ